VRLEQFRGLVVFLIAVGGIVIAWTAIENRPIDAVVAVATTTTSTTTTTAVPTTTTPAEAVQAICFRSAQFSGVAAALPTDSGPGPTARLALQFWTDILDIAPPDLRTEVVAVVAYYGDYLDLAEPFEFDASRIIVEGDKERFQQLVTRPAPGLSVARNLIAFACGIEVPDQPSMSATAYADLENRLLFPDEKP